MFKTLIVAGIAAFVGKKLYDKGTLDPYIAEARKQMKMAFPQTGTGTRTARKSTRSKRKAGPKSFAPPPHIVPAG